MAIVQIEPFYERLLQFASSEPASSEIIEARIRYFAELGRISESEQVFERHLTTFLDWYVFDRKLEGIGLTPAELYFRDNAGKLGEDEARVFEGFTKTRRGLFQVVRADAAGIRLKDLFCRSKLYVRDERPRGFAPKEIFQGRLIPIGDESFLAEALVFHPMRANRYIKSQARAARKSGDAARERLLIDLALKRLKVDRYKHVDVRYFYK